MELKAYPNIVGVALDSAGAGIHSMELKGGAFLSGILLLLLRESIQWN